MKALRTAFLLLCAGFVLASTPAFAQKDDAGVPDEPAAGPNCDITGYKTERLVYPTPIPIPDNNAAGITLGPIFMPPDGDIVNDVVLELNAAHTWVGDIVMDLIYDPDCSGPAAGIPARVLCRARGSNASPPAPCGTGVGVFGCSGNLVATNPYFFSDEGVNPLGVGTGCTTNIAAGCYRQSDIGGQRFDVWRGLPKGGCWYLVISDNAGADLGTVSGWAVYVRNQRPVSVENTSWGAVKNIYR